jgi:transposase
MGLRCKRCGSEAYVKNGLMRCQQRYLCKECGLNFTDTPPRGTPLALKAAAVLLYGRGLSMNCTAKLLGVSPPRSRPGWSRSPRLTPRSLSQKVGPS